MRELLFAIAIVITSAGAELQRDGVVVATVTAPSKVARDGAREDRAFYSHVTRGEVLGTIRIVKPLLDARGDEIPPGIYTLRYAVQPLLKDHAGTSKWRDFALVISDPPRQGHPWVLALVPPEETTTIIEIGGQRFGFALDQVVASAF